VTATVFDDHTDAEAYATLLTSAGSSGLLIGSKSERAVLGGNWVVLVPDDATYASQVSTALGGTVLGGSSSSSSAGSG
jgi:predicted enzyme related to lactoylglutathione lyase